VYNLDILLGKKPNLKNATVRIEIFTIEVSATYLIGFVVEVNELEYNDVGNGENETNNEKHTIGNVD